MAIPETPINRQEMYLDAIARKSGGGGGGSALPAVTSADNGKVLWVVDGAWAADDKRFVVTCTPTAADYSGTMNKSIEEIRAAYYAGKEIWFEISGAANVPLFAAGVSGENLVFYSWVVLTTQNLLVLLMTNASGPDASQYNTKLYQLTPMGS